MSINSRNDEEFIKMPPTEDEPLLGGPKKSFFADLYDRKVKPRVRTHCSARFGVTDIPYLADARDAADFDVLWPVGALWHRQQH